MAAYLATKRKLDRKTAELVVQAFGKTVGKRTRVKPITITLESFLSDKIQISRVINQGLPYSYFESVRAFAPFRNEDWSRLLNISNKTLLRHKTNKSRLKSPTSEKVIGLAEVTQAGLDAFGSIEKFKLWLDAPNYALGSLKPIELLENSYGKDLVLGELNNIQFGIFA